MEEKISARLQQFETVQQKKFDEFAESIQQSLSKLLDTATEKFQQGLQPQLDQMASTMAQMQHAVLERLNNISNPVSSASTHGTMPTMTQTPVSSVPIHYNHPYNLAQTHPLLTTNIATSQATLESSSPGDTSE